jgi:hypothetical protein
MIELPPILSRVAELSLCNERPWRRSIREAGSTRHTDASSRPCSGIGPVLVPGCTHTGGYADGQVIEEVVCGSLTRPLRLPGGISPEPLEDDTA